MIWMNSREKIIPGEAKALPAFCLLQTGNIRELVIPPIYVNLAAMSNAYWKRWYIAVLLWLTLLILFFTWFTRIWS